MLWHDKPLKDLTASEFREAVEQNNALAEAVIDMERPEMSAKVREWVKKAQALHAEGVRRGLIGMNGHAAG